MAFNQLQSELSAWPRVRIGEVAEVFDGPHATPKKTAVGPIFLGISALNRGRLDLTNTEHLSEDEFVKWTRRVTPTAGDVVFSYETRIGEAAIIPEGLRCCLGRRMGLVRTNPLKLDPYFFLYQYLSPIFQDFLTSRTIHGSTVDRISLKEFPDFEIELPTLAVQRQIAKVMLDIDSKIGLNHHINQTLEAMAQAIFKSWFFDFVPVQAKIAAKQEGRDPLRAAMSAISGKLDAELDALPPEQYAQIAATAALFPDEMEESELGEIPKGWESSTLGEICAAHGGLIQTGPFGSQLHAHDYRDAGIPVVMPQDLSGRRIQTTKIARISESDAQRLQRHRMKPGDIVFSRRGDVGKHALVTHQEAGWLCGTGCMLVRPSTTSTISAYVSCALALPEALEWLVRHAVGATMPNLNTAILSELPILSAEQETVAAFEKFVSALEKTKNSCLAEALTLVSLRDTLLPKLLSGELSIENVSPESEVTA